MVFKDCKAQEIASFLFKQAVQDCKELRTSRGDLSLSTERRTGASFSLPFQSMHGPPSACSLHSQLSMHVDSVFLQRHKIFTGPRIILAEYLIILRIRAPRCYESVREDHCLYFGSNQFVSTYASPQGS